MKWFTFFVVLVHLTLVLAELDVDSDSGNSTKVLARRKRYIIFRDYSRGFARANIKDRMVDSTNVWAQGIGYRWNVEFNNPPGLKIAKRDLHQSLGELLENHGFDGRACILRAFCELSKVVTPESGMLFKLFRKIFTHSAAATDASSTGSNSLPEGDESYFPYLKSGDCEELDRHCPISQLEVPVEDNHVAHHCRSGVPGIVPIANITFAMLKEMGDGIHRHLSGSQVGYRQELEHLQQQLVDNSRRKRTGLQSTLAIPVIAVPLTGEHPISVDNVDDASACL